MSKKSGGSVLKLVLKNAVETADGTLVITLECGCRLAMMVDAYGHTQAPLYRCKDHRP